MDGELPMMFIKPQKIFLWAVEKMWENDSSHFLCKKYSDRKNKSTELLAV